MPFQTQVFAQPAPGLEGDFCSVNPRDAALAGQFGFIAGASGVRIGFFCWASYESVDNDSAPAIVNSFGNGPVLGFVHNNKSGLITSFLAEYGMFIPNGFPVTVFSGGDFWARNNGVAVARRGMKAYADYLTGAISFAATGSPTTANFTGGIAAGTFSVTGSITGNVMTVTAGSGVVPGAAISGTNVASGSRVVKQLTGTTGGIGTYAVTPPEQTAASTTISGTYGTLTVSAGTNPPIGSLLTTGASAGTFVTAQGGSPTVFIVNNTQTVAGGTSLVGATNIETKFVAMSDGLVGELVKITDQLLG